ncbi:methionine ABC transporter ATP-binding protein [Paenibacillus durus]|uniref:ABC transporter n=2 Tax=Paenibacillus durus TaxID=44251 RepID=A0A0F7FDR2_PAEDU|nr:ATP-binding cassette domain-containing protein [Paenibacillus durus]AKG36678.1 ABC transporter [Paenibacillus durus ATCC 35681]
MITVTNLNKSYRTRSGTVSALTDINLHIEKGEIFGIIGFSGAGKSTLIRCLNRLEEPDSGSIQIGETIITDLKERELRLARRKIGMIFQQFNLFDSKTVFGNVAFPLKAAGYKKPEIERRVGEILDLVELGGKAGSYPSELSGGQKQRVGIARALAGEPDVLLSDEATSALDPQTTHSILELLADINRRLGLTVVLITHEMDVLRHICGNAAVIEAGRIVENAPVRQLFHNPQSDTAKRFAGIYDFYNNSGNSGQLEVPKSEEREAVLR